MASVGTAAGVATAGATGRALAAASATAAAAASASGAGHANAGAQGVASGSTGAAGAGPVLSGAAGAASGFATAAATGRIVGVDGMAVFHVVGVSADLTADFIGQSDWTSLNNALMAGALQALAVNGAQGLAVRIGDGWVGRTAAFTVNF
jgi:hypothetical protein